MDVHCEHEIYMVRTSPRLAKDVDMTEESELRRLESGTAETFHDETIVQAGGGGGACDGDEADAVVEAGARTSVSEVGALGGSGVGQKEYSFHARCTWCRLKPGSPTSLRRPTLASCHDCIINNSDENGIGPSQ